MTYDQTFLGLAAVAIGFGGGVAFVECLRSRQPRRGTLALIAAILVLLALTIVVLVARMGGPGA